MSWRIVVISRGAKLDYKMNYLMVRQDSITRIHLSEIGLLLIESTAVALTARLLSELIKRKIKVIFCDEKRNPSSELVGYYGAHDTSDKIRQQVSWSHNTKQLIWTEIVSDKIKKQRDFLIILGKTNVAKMLDGYLEEMLPGDSSNREGHAAKVYFNAVFGSDYSRNLEIPFNAALDYGYSLLLSAFNREIVSAGYITQIGLFHDNMFNYFNLSSDLMEPFRILVDKAVYVLQPKKFEHDEKMEILRVLNDEVTIIGKNYIVTSAIKIYCQSVFEAINENDVLKLRFYSDKSC